jgi:hypothetical protein
MRHKLSGVTLNAIMELNLIIALALAFGIGLSLGLLGSGGSIVTLPVLVYGRGACGFSGGHVTGDCRRDERRRRVVETPARLGSLAGGSLVCRHGHGWLVGGGAIDAPCVARSADADFRGTHGACRSADAHAARR